MRDSLQDVWPDFRSFRLVDVGLNTKALQLRFESLNGTDAGVLFFDSTITSAVLDRLLHNAETMIIEGKSYTGDFLHRRFRSTLKRRAQETGDSQIHVSLAAKECIEMLVQPAGHLRAAPKDCAEKAERDRKR